MITSINQVRTGAYNSAGLWAAVVARLEIPLDVAQLGDLVPASPSAVSGELDIRVFLTIANTFNTAINLV